MDNQPVTESPAATESIVDTELPNLTPALAKALKVFSQKLDSLITSAYVPISMTVILNGKQIN